MSTWELERWDNPAGTGTGDRRTFAAWGFASHSLLDGNWAKGELVCVYPGPTAMVDASPFGFRDKIVVWRDGVRVWHGWRVQIIRRAPTEIDSQQVRFVGPWWWLETTPIRDPDKIKDHTYETQLITIPGYGTVEYQRPTGCTWETPAGDLVWPDWDSQSRVTAQGQIVRALYAAIWAGAPIAIGTIGVTGPAPEQDSRNATCAAWAQSAARYDPLAVQWWDFSGTLPIFHCTSRSGATPYSHPLYGLDREPTLYALEELQVQAVRIRYYFAEDTTGIETYHLDKAGDDDWPEGPGALIASVECGDRTTAGKAWAVGVAAKMYAALHPLAYGGALSLVETSAPLPWYRPGHALNITGGRTEWATMAALVQQVTWSISADSEACQVMLGAADHLGITDWLELSRIGRDAASSSRDDGDTDTIDQLPGGDFGDLDLGDLTFEEAIGGCEYRSLSGTTYPLGRPTYGTALTPPQFFLREDYSGSISYRTNVGDCGTAPSGNGEDHEWSGSTVIDPLHYDTETRTGQRKRTVYSWGNATESTHSQYTQIIADPYPGVYASEVTATTSTISGTDACVSGTISSITTGTATSTLSVESTDEDAIARAVALDYSWGAWGSSASTAIAGWQIRTGTTFAFAKVQVRGSWAGGRPNWEYTVTVNMESTNYGEAAWVPDGQLKLKARASASGVITLPPTDIPCPRGKQRRVAATPSIDWNT